jgi:membrane protein YdbS with pleckstrin-like domain
MWNNIGSVDRGLKKILALALFSLWLFNITTGFWSATALLFYVIFLFTAWLGFCPIYYFFKITTKKQETLEAEHGYL